MTGDQVTAQEREPLGSMFVGTGEYVVIHGGTYGPFLNEQVAWFWGCDAFGRGTFSVVRCEPPWRVPVAERRS